MNANRAAYMPGIPFWCLAGTVVLGSGVFWPLQVDASGCQTGNTLLVLQPLFGSRHDSMLICIVGTCYQVLVSTRTRSEPAAVMILCFVGCHNIKLEN